MRNTDYFKDKKVTVVGLARSGLACARLLSDLGAQVSVTDNQDSEPLRLNAEELKAKNIKIELGGHAQEFIKGRDVIVVSPGVSNTSLPIKWAQGFKIPIISEIEVGWILCPATIIAVTGTNGKTTVTTLIAKVLTESAKTAIACGNIGNPFCGELQKIEEHDFVSLEVSSFQLERIQKFKPKIAVILNFSLNHLDRYKNTAEYWEAKKRISMNQDSSDYLVLNSQDSLLKGLAKETKAKAVYFSEEKGPNPNQAAVLAVASILKIDKELVLRVFREFKGIAHRLEQVAGINNIKFVNDSKATTVDAAIWALKNTPESVILIAGGRDKGNDYSIILELAKKKVKKLILIGEAKKKMKNAFNNSLSLFEAATLEEAVQLAFRCASAGDCVLLSPMCSSFDMFSNYEERGAVFKKAVYGLVRDNS
jgi:UDP-N-acetylmuramoylalanine--D-glutamate ligase